MAVTAHRPPLQAWASRLLGGGALEDKLQPAPPVETWRAGSPGPGPIDVDLPARSGALVMADVGAGAGDAFKQEKLPALPALKDAEARVICIHRFAHHELMAIELFAWALLRFPDLDDVTTRGMVAALEEEQAHLRLYLERLEHYGARFGDLPLSGYFWKLMPGVRAASDPLRAFMCMQGLTLEQANLDFTIHYRDGFAAAGDDDTAAVLARIHADEIGHVRLARAHLLRDARGRTDGITGDGVDDDLRLYQDHVPFPLSAARAKGRRFEVGARKKAGLSTAFIDFVREAKPYASSSSGATSAASVSSS